MSSILFSLPDIYNSYRTWINHNPQSASDFETTAKWISYFIAGRIHNSHVVSELVYSLSNLLVLFNDRIIANARQLRVSNSGDQLKVWLTVLEYSEVFLELSAKKLWGNIGKWLVVVCIQVFKCISRLILVYHHKENIIEIPPIPVLPRNNLIPFDYNNVGDISASDRAQAQLDSISFTLKHSGKVIRKIDSSPPLEFRNWKPIELQSENEQTIEQVLAGRQLIAETVYILKPIVHLGSTACLGVNTWKPWAISLLMDLASLHLYHSCKITEFNSLTKTQRLQLSRRSLVMVLYFLRSPFYEKYGQKNIYSLLNCLSKKVPLASFICNPLMQYLPFWQSTYFYMWST